jgi:DeoR/GlpR family transcriptional regulator of sugar metabolism
MIHAADEAYVLTDASKFGHACLATYARLDEVAMIITDPGIPAHFLEAFTQRGIPCRLADPNSGPSSEAPLAEAV